ncbi:hypothetical protein TNCV_489501 [Trichonephila clavipes]|nr:hypothetical protein TNCV_489501 [Trichonephila clavipes]
MRLLLHDFHSSKSALIRGLSIAVSQFYRWRGLQSVFQVKSHLDSDDENEINKADAVPASWEMKIMKSMRSYLDAPSNGEMSNKMDDIE